MRGLRERPHPARGEVSTRLSWRLQVAPVGRARMPCPAQVARVPTCRPRNGSRAKSPLVRDSVSRRKTTLGGGIDERHATGVTGRMKRLMRFLPFGGAAVKLPRVAVMGALRTGTNYLKFLLESNYFVRADFSPFGWKHGGVPIVQSGGPMAYPEVPLAYIVKNPFAFSISLHRYQRRKSEQGHAISLQGADAWDDFLVRPIEIFDSQLPGSPRMRFANPIQYWNFLYWNLETLDRSRFRVHGVNYERLVADPDALREIESAFSLVRRHATTVTPRNNLKRLGEAPIGVSPESYQTDDAFELAYYTEHRYLEAFSDAQRSFVRAEADPWIMERRGYATR